MRLCFRVNRSLFRAQAALMAALYVLLCTLGAVTHVDAFSELPAPSAESLQAGSALSPASHQATLLAPAHCAYCEWQASSVSVALSAQTLPTPTSVGYASVPHRLTVVSFDPPQSSSRAPPVV